MALTYDELTELLLQAGPKFTIEVTHSDGRRSVYRGHDVTAFVQHGDHRLHEHTVYDQQGNMVYYRDANGRLYEGDIDQWRKYARRQQMGRTALSVFRQSVDGALRYWGQGGRRLSKTGVSTLLKVHGAFRQPAHSCVKLHSS